MRKLLLIALVGYAAALNFPSSSEEEENSLAKRLPLSLQALGQCVIYDSFIQTNATQNYAKNCIEDSVLQAFLPALYIGTAVQPTECMEDFMDNIDPRYRARHISDLSNALTQKMTKNQFCNFIEKTLLPATCASREKCTSNKDRRAIDGSIAVFQSVQEFLNDGMDTDFNCKKGKIRINPELYKYGIKYDENIEFLDRPINCSHFSAGNLPWPSSSTKKLETTTLKQTATGNSGPGIEI
ncbi:hypothetical protein M3Y97_00626800 [Aphelenchoides bicaudatus]|nr:hypothetical protein M3Y97_00626800 [Aphelenchoides bicaudatus]